jgi:hypothetical protein
MRRSGAWLAGASVLLWALLLAATFARLAVTGPALWRAVRLCR